MKRSQIQTQIFVYVIALIVITLILIYGYKAISNFIERSDEVNLVQFRTDLTNVIDMQSQEYGSTIRKDLVLPRNFNKIIFIDLGKGPNGTFYTDYPIIHDSWTGGVQKNIFILGKSSTESFYAGKLEFEEEDHILINVPDRQLKLKLIGMGGSTKVGKWE